MRILHYDTFADGGAAVLMLRLHSALGRPRPRLPDLLPQSNLQLPDAQRLGFC